MSILFLNLKRYSANLRILPITIFFKYFNLLQFSSFKETYFPFISRLKQLSTQLLSTFFIWILCTLQHYLLRFCYLYVSYIFTNIFYSFFYVHSHAHFTYLKSYYCWPLAICLRRDNYNIWNTNVSKHGEDDKIEMF